MAKPEKSRELKISDVHEIARMANIPITDEEAKEYYKQLHDIINYINDLDEVDTDSVKELTHPLNQQNTSFEDGSQNSINLKPKDLESIHLTTKKGKVYFSVKKKT